MTRCAFCHRDDAGVDRCRYCQRPTCAACHHGDAHLTACTDTALHELSPKARARR